MGGRGTFAAGNPVPYVYNVDTTFSPQWEVGGRKNTQRNGNTTRTTGIFA